MRIKDKRSYLVYAQPTSDVPLTLNLLDTAGKTVHSVAVTGNVVTLTVPVGLTAEFVSADGQAPSSATVNGADVTTASLTGVGNGGYILTTHPRVGDMVGFIQ